ncbi:MAG: hypothetical protein ABI835_06725 [Chloroflexota bacterium]
MSDSTNYPDILGLITGGSRSSIGAAQVAVTTRPRIVRAGRPFEVILLVQNASDGEIDVTMALHLPASDAKRQRDRFITRTQRLVVNVKGAEVGYVMLPVTTMPDTAVSDGYKIGVEIEIKPLGKASRVRASDGGGQVALDLMSDESKAKIEALKNVIFTTDKNFGRSIIEAPLTVMSGGVGAITDFTPGWVSICKMSDYGDDRLMLHHYGPTVQVNTLPKLKRSIMYPPLLEATTARFAEAGYPLKDAEASAIAKLMTLILEYATPRFNAHGSLAARSFDVEALLNRDPFKLESPPAFPHWFRALLHILERDERAASHAAQVIPRYLYDDLLRDAIDFGFDLATEATGDDLGSPEERAAYREGILGALHDTGLDFSRVYLPLIMGAVLINDQLTLEKEDPSELVRMVAAALRGRSDEVSRTDEGVYIMAHEIIARSGQRYGFQVDT